MAKRLSELATGRDNNFNLVRFIAAAMVLVSHAVAVSTGSSPREPFRNLFFGMSLGDMAVDIFFVTSGFLVTGSLFNRKNVLSFIKARILRIFPALLAALIVCVLAIGLFFTTLPATVYLENPATWKFAWKNLGMALDSYAYQLPGVFRGNPFSDTVNAPLWSLPFEVRMYSILALFGLIGHGLNWLKEKHVRFLLVVLGVGALVGHIYYYFQYFRAWSMLTLVGLHLSSMFFIGAAFWVLRGRIVLSPAILVVLLATLAASRFRQDTFFVAYQVLVPGIVLSFAYLPSRLLLNFNRIGDYSYGMYIYAFPIQQSLAALLPGISPGPMIAWSLAVTLLVSILSWHLLEKRCLAFKNLSVARQPLFKEEQGLGRQVEAGQP